MLDRTSITAEITAEQAARHAKPSTSPLVGGRAATMPRPWLKFYPSDWRGEPRLRLCSLAAHGLWINLITYMHEGEPYGHLNINGIAPDENQIARLLGSLPGEVRKALAELESQGVFSRTADGVIFSRRMVRDEQRFVADRNNGRRGGNPKINPPLKGGQPPG